MKRTLALALSCLLPAAALQADDADTDQASVPGDFAAGLTLETQPHLAAQTLLLPLEVYRGTRAGLPDLAVFDGDGRPVPYAVRALETRASDRREEEKAPLFPLREQANSNVSDLQLHVERAESGTVIDIRSSAAQPAPEAKVVAYIIDASYFHHDVAGIRLVLAASETSFTAPFKVEASDDLASWRTLTSGSVIGRLSHDGQSVERERIELIATSATFLRLSWPGQELPVAVQEAYLEFTSQRVDFTRARVRDTTVPVSAKNGAYELDLGGVLALESLQPLLPENVLIRATLALRDQPNDARSQVFEGQLYRLRHEGTELASAPIDLAARRARLVTLSVDPRGTGLANRPLAFEVQYAPDQLLFITHAPGPYLLAFGSHKDATRPFAANQLLEFMTPAAREALPRESARVIGTRVLSGPGARTAPLPAPSYKTPLLWAVLIAGAATLLLLALRLLRKTG